MSDAPEVKFNAASLGEMLKNFKPKDFNFIRIYTDEGGVTRLEEKTVNEEGHMAPVIWARKAEAVKLAALPAGVEIPFHLTSQPMLLVLLKGLAVYWVDGDGVAGKSYYPQVPGSVFLCEDSTGGGHGGRLLGTEDAVVLEVRLGKD